MNDCLRGRRRRSLLSLLASLLLFPTVAQPAAAQAPAAPPPPVTVAKPIVREIVEDDEFIGRFEAVDEVSIRARVGGYLETVHFRDGALVKVGDPLFTIDQRPFQFALEQAQSQLAVSETSLTFAESQYRRAEELSQSGNIPVSTVDDRRREFLAAQASHEGAKTAVASAQLDLEYTEITAPIAGRIDRRLVSTGNLVQADQTILTSIVSLDPIDFYFDIDEREFLAYARDATERGGNLQEGAGGLPVVVHLPDGGTDAISGELNFAENRIDRETGTMRVRARFPNPDLTVLPGLFGRVNVPGSLPHQGVLVPDEAIGADQDRRIVYVVGEDNTVSAKPVRTGPRLYGYRVVRSGLTGEETIVVNGLMRVRPNIKVDPRPETLPPERVAEGAQ
ncbi:MAG: efflux RND transporter periplasmic adaptor subunit [Aurantimonas endophytica]|uniref:RND family efflux transporter MFP subunit n=1 Tax=Aurantimonas endophytica TaxID=1522175 RepID=A0A7W6H9R6_9HYPH|nr:efflux RND transporter periplasmic adaptor subunit [Aurantimonas endophytica]MBB4001178.1 RND family efflux transporter MFP subunit [Aurantimonas endophytica]MCO6403168.1 efflux RND transporter periplasmic adaptor subunit [Aurantimonas endophytica]